MDPSTRLLSMGAAGATSTGPGSYIEDVFNTWLYTGNGSTQTITNGIDLSTNGGLVWIKRRDGVGQNQLFRQAEKRLASDDNNAESTTTGAVTSFNTTGFSIGANYSSINGSGLTYASWTFRKAAKFFDVVTYTGNGANRTIAHNLGSVPGVIIVKRTDTIGDWVVYHRSLANTEYLTLNTTTGVSTNATLWNSTTPTSTQFSLGTDSSANANGGTYVAYLFAHDAGGFGDSGNDSAVACGTVTGSADVNLGWEPQFVLLKYITGSNNWTITDAMRGAPVPATGNTPYAPVVAPNLSNAENTTGILGATAIFSQTGFKINPDTALSGTYVYIAIRRGPMKTPTDATKVFNAATSAASTGTVITTNFPIDLQVVDSRIYGGGAYWSDRLRGVSTQNVNETKPYLYSYATDAEQTATQYTRDWDNTGFDIPSYTAGGSTAYWSFRRAPGFLDVVAYTGNDATSRNITHNLGVVPEFIIAKSRTTVTFWETYHKDVGANYSTRLNSSNARLLVNNDKWANTVPTSSVFTVGIDLNYGTVTSGGAAVKYIAYLFASCPGVSKVGSYTGTGTTLQINCGFTAGARFIIIKRTDSTGDWYVWDTARGIVSGNDPYLLLNSTAAEVTNTDYIDPLNSGFEISSTAPADINANGGSFIFLAVA